jgi:acyl dehydratase
VSFDPLALLRRQLPTVRQRYEARDTILYALGVGAGHGTDTWDERHLRFVYEAQLQALPTMCAMLGDPGFWMRDADTGLDWARLVHAEEDMQWPGVLPPHGDVTGHNRVASVEDRGPGRGALFVVERKLVDSASGQTLARSRTSVLARGNGGFAGGDPARQRLGAAAPPPLPPWPARPADRVVRRATATHQPLLYRLSADPNPLHVDPAVARHAGFERPIMHGMCTFGLLGLLIVQEFCGFDAARLQALRARFTAPLYPGETLDCEFWRDADEVRFRATCVERGAVVLDLGRAQVGDRPAPSPGATA